jgi:hypothetical protein
MLVRLLALMPSLLLPALCDAAVALHYGGGRDETSFHLFAPSSSVPAALWVIAEDGSIVAAERSEDAEGVVAGARGGASYYLPAALSGPELPGGARFFPGEALKDAKSPCPAPRGFKLLETAFVESVAGLKGRVTASDYMRMVKPGDKKAGPVCEALQRVEFVDAAGRCKTLQETRKQASYSALNGPEICGEADEDLARVVHFYGVLQTGSENRLIFQGRRYRDGFYRTIRARKSLRPLGFEDVDNPYGF